MTRFSFMTAVCATALIVSGGFGHAREDSRPGFDEIDANGDGEISLEELLAIGAGRFDAIDTNGDGKIDEAEMLAAIEARAEARTARIMARLDTNGDGVLSREEMQGRRDPGRWLTRFDTDNSGTLSRAEFDTARETMKQRRAARRQAN